MPPPAWLGQDAPDNEIAVSSRVRFARNLYGHQFPNHAGTEELRDIARKIKEHAQSLQFEGFRRLTDAEREYMVGCRLMSPDFRVDLPGRMLLLNADRSVSLMVNEEDHLRIQALTAGWSIRTADALARRTLKDLETSLRWAWAEPWGHLTTSPHNAGSAIRLSTMLHLVGLGHTKRLNEVLHALAKSDLTARGLFGETSRAVGAFFQVSSTRDDLARFIGAVEYVMREERLARSSLSMDELQHHIHEAIRYVVMSYRIEMADALRVLAWVRWGAAVGVPGLENTLREIDALLSTLEVRPDAEADRAGEERAATLRNRFESVLHHN